MCPLFEPTWVSFSTLYAHKSNPPLDFLVFRQCHRGALCALEPTWISFSALDAHESIHPWSSWYPVDTRGASCTFIADTPGWTLDTLREHI